MRSWDNVVVHQLRQPQLAAQPHRQGQPCIGHQPVVVNGDVNTVTTLARAAQAGTPAAWRAARSVLASSIAMVIGPTPPGTGVIADAFSATAS